jgi:hypothetical protein
VYNNVALVEFIKAEEFFLGGSSFFSGSEATFPKELTFGQNMYLQVRIQAQIKTG